MLPPPCRHWYLSVGAPAATTEKLAVVFAFTVWLCGGWVITGQGVSTRPLPTQPEMAVTLVNPAGASDPNPAPVPSLLSARPGDTPTTLGRPAGTPTFQPETVPSLPNTTIPQDPFPAMPTTLLPPLKPSSENLPGSTVPSLRTPVLKSSPAPIAT